VAAAGPAIGVTVVPPKVVVSVVNWNTPDLTIACVRALLRQTYGDCEVVIVDNASSDDSVQRFAQTLTGIRVLRSPHNVGFAAGHENAARHALSGGAGALWIVNSDAQAAPDALARLVSAWQAHGDHLYGSVPLAPDAPLGAMQFPEKYSDPGGRPRALYRDRPGSWPVARDGGDVLAVAAVLGSSMLIPCALIARHGWMAGDWFMHCEEIDYCYRLRGLGVRSYLVPASRLRHAGAGSQSGRPRVGDCIAYYRARNEIRLTAQHGRRGSSLMVAVKKAARALASVPRRPARAWAILRGAIDGVVGRRGKTVDPDAALARDRAELASALLAADTGLRSFIRRAATWRQRRFAARVRELPSEHAGTEAGISRLCWPRDVAPHLRAYFEYCVRLFEQQLWASRQPLQVVFRQPGDAWSGGALWRSVGIQFEHTLVAPGGRDSAGARPGPVPLQDGSGHYLLRLDNEAYLRTLDVMIDYSRANLEHLRRSQRYDDLLARSIGIAPLLYEPHFGTQPRAIAAVTTFSDPRQPRRARVLHDMRRLGVPVRNVRGVYASGALRELLDSTRILVNVHQTAHHHTLEELRVLPALLRGVLVVSERVPLMQSIAYADFVIWADPEQIAATVHAVHVNYDAYRERIFGGGRLLELIATMRLANDAAVAGCIAGLVRTDG